MRELSIKITCDICGEKTPEAAAIELTGTDRTGKALTLDLCEGCLSYTNVRATTLPASQPHVCTWCNTGFKTTRGLNQHKTKVGHA